MKKALFSILLFLAIGGGIAYYFLAFPASAENPGVVVARVGRTALTQEDLRKRLPPEFSEYVTYEQNVDYVKRWVDAEILYQAALLQKIDLEPPVRARLEQMRKDLLMSEMIGRLSLQSAEISDPDIENFYQEHLDDFHRKESEIKYVHLCFKTMSDAWRIRNQITAENFFDLGKTVTVETVEDTTGLPWLSRDQVAPELAEVIFDIKIGGTTPPIKTPSGFYIVKIIDKKGPGTIRAMEEVRNEIVNRIVSLRQRSQVDQMVSQFRKKMMVECFADRIPGKSSARAEKEQAAAVQESAP